MRICGFPDPTRRAAWRLRCDQVLKGSEGFGDLKKEQRVAAIVGSLARVKLGQKGLQTIPFTFEDEMLEALGKGELDAALATPATIGYYNLLHKDAPVMLVRDYENMPELRWEVAVGIARRTMHLWRRSTPRSTTCLRTKSSAASMRGTVSSRVSLSITKWTNVPVGLQRALTNIVIGI